jgi:hypothetical protein
VGAARRKEQTLNSWPSTFRKPHLGVSGHSTVKTLWPSRWPQDPKAW